MPANLEGNALVPFMQSMIIIHFTVTIMLLLYTLCFYVVDRYYASAVSREQSKYREGTKAVWQRHAANYNKWVDALLPATALVEDPESPETGRRGSSPNVALSITTRAFAIIGMKHL